jgi:predicted metallopeptidase
MATIYSYDNGLATLGRNVLNQHHTHLADVRVEFVFRDKASVSHGRDVWGKARKVTGMAAFLALPKDDAPDYIGDAEEVEPFFVIEIAHNVWEVLTGKQRLALLDHELSHCRVRFDGEKALLEVAPHDLEEFEGVIRRNGLWNDSARTFTKVAADHVDELQLNLLAGDGDGGD